MKRVRYIQDHRTYFGLLDGTTIRRLAGDLCSDEVTGVRDDLASVKLLAPVDKGRIIGVGFNYKAHTIESGRQLPTIPCLFMKPFTSVIGPDEPVLYPRSETDLIVHYEGEVAVVIGRRARHLSVANALDAVLGYTCANDISERITQRAEMAMGCLLIGKGWDTFCPLGPCIETDIDPAHAVVTTRVNGEVRQKGDTSDLIFPIVDLLVYLSRSITLAPGDVILTGSPAGVGPLKPGDRMEVEVEGVGILANAVELEPEFQ